MTARPPAISAVPHRHDAGTTTNATPGPTRGHATTRTPAPPSQHKTTLERTATAPNATDPHYASGNTTTAALLGCAAPRRERNTGEQSEDAPARLVCARAGLATLQYGRPGW
jgi:hypothetical protein